MQGNGTGREEQTLVCPGVTISRAKSQSHLQLSWKGETFKHDQGLRPCFGALQENTMHFLASQPFVQCDIGR